MHAYLKPLVRISLGWLFVWAFLDKLFGLGFATSAEQAWLAGGSPTAGFLTHATKGPFASFFQYLATCQTTDWLFMAGLILIGLAMILGIGLRIAGYSGALMMLLMWLAVLPPAHNPFMDEHIIYCLIFLYFAGDTSKQLWGLGNKWKKLKFVKKRKWLQ